MGKLIPKTIAKQIPGIGATQMLDIHQQKVVVKLFATGTNWTWYIIEFDGSDECFGYAIGLDEEFGYFSLKDLEQINSPLRRVERDLYFKPISVAELLLQRTKKGA